MLLRRTLTFCCLLVLAFLTVALPGPVKAQDQRLVLAFYYTWYDTGQWAADKVPDLPVIPYNSRDRETIERHGDQARAAGIDAFVVSWYGPQVENNQTETNFRILLDVAQAKGLRATVDVDLGASPFLHSASDVSAALRHVLTVHAQHPAFLRYGGKPLIFFWRQERFSVETWQAIRAEVDPDHDSLWIAEGVDLDYLAVFDGLHLYNITWDPPSDVSYTLSRWGRRVREYNAAHTARKLWVATVMPGYDDTKAPGRAHTYRYDRRNGEYYRQTWQAAIASSPDLVIITSFNEWVEGTMIEPSVSYGNLYLDITAQESARYKSTIASEEINPTPTPEPPVATSTATLPPTATLTPSPTVTPSPTATSTATFTPSPTVTPMPTATATTTATHTLSPTPASPTATPLPTMTNSSPLSAARDCPDVVVPAVVGLVALALTGRVFVIRFSKHRE